jgi:hypothetical protein
MLMLLLSGLSAFAVQPDSSKTPGKLCTTSDPDFMGLYYKEGVPRCKRNVPTSEKQQIGASYSISESSWPNYEFDHLIPLCAGGADSPENVWPQPLNEAHVKDVLENQVCLELQAGTMTQNQAVQKIKDWISQH